MRPKVHTEKHIVQHSVTNVSFGSTTNLVIVDAQAEPTGITQVREGAIVSAVYIELWIAGTDAQPSSVSVNLEKKLSADPPMSNAQAITLNNYPNKKNVFYITQGLVGDSNSNPIPFVRQWFKVPKGKQNFGLLDRLILNITGLTNDIDFCGVFIYKEQF